jgi:CHAT domain-containing protein/tetratricopeptide (TPR) repeat protein
VEREIRQKTQRGELDAALQLADHFYRAYATKNPELGWRFRVLKAEILVMRGSNKEALSLLDENLPPSLANTYIAIRRKMAQGSAYEALRQFPEAKQDLDEAGRLANVLHFGLQGDVAIRQGTLEMDLGRYRDAEAAFHETLSIARQHAWPSLEASALGDLGLVATKQERYDESIDWNRQALRFAQSSGQGVAVPNILGNMGWSYYQLGDFDNALLYYNQAEEAAAKAGLVTNSVDWLNNIGTVYYEQRDYRSSEATMQRALNLARALDDKRTTTECLVNLSDIALETGRVDLAERYNKEATDLERAGFDQFSVLYSLEVTGRIEATRHNFARAKELFQEIIQDPDAETALRWQVETRLAMVYADEGRPTVAEREFRKSFRTIEAVRSSVRTEELRLSFLSGAVSFYDDYIDFLIARGRTSEALEVAEVSRARTLADGLGFSSRELTLPLKGFDPMQLAKQLNTVVLSYWLGPKHSYLWAVTPDRISLFTLPAASEIDPLVRSYRATLVTDPRDVLETRNTDGQRLYQLLVAPAKESIPRGSSVTILPYGSLYGLNFETLLVPAPELHYWIEDVVVTNASSLVLLAASAHERPRRTRKLLLVGDPVPPASEYPDLPQASPEMTEIEKYFPSSGRVVLSREKATAESYLASQPQQFTFIHFVAHGTASSTSPLDSAVILTKRGDSYKLYARDIIKQPLRADLVTISACYGAGARAYSGEGLVGLTWAFLRAGARGVISALWEVNDNSTPQIMDRLYAELTTGHTPSAALRHAKLALVHSHSVYKKPFYWAPFQIYRGL